MKKILLCIVFILFYSINFELFAQTYHRVTIFADPYFTGNNWASRGVCIDGNPLPGVSYAPIYNNTLVKAGDTITITAIPDCCCIFTSWIDAKTGNLISTTNPLKVVVTQDTMIRAHFLDGVGMVQFIQILANKLCCESLPDNDHYYDVYWAVSDFRCGVPKKYVISKPVGFCCCKFKAWEDKNGKVLATTDTIEIISYTRDTVIYQTWERQKFDITLKTTPIGAGTATTNKPICDCDDSAILTATPASGYAFVNWTNSVGTPVSTSATYSFTITENTTLTANFVTTPTTNYTLTLNRNPANAGTVSGAGSYPSGTKVPIEATVTDNCYTFKNWTNANGMQLLL